MRLRKLVRKVTVLLLLLFCDCDFLFKLMLHSLVTALRHGIRTSVGALSHDREIVGVRLSSITLWPGTFSANKAEGDATWLSGRCVSSKFASDSRDCPLRRRVRRRFASIWFSSVQFGRIGSVRSGLAAFCVAGFRDATRRDALFCCQAVLHHVCSCTSSYVSPSCLR